MLNELPADLTCEPSRRPPHKLSHASWTELLVAYARGESAPALSRTWGVSTRAIYRRARLAGLGKQGAAREANVGATGETPDPFSEATPNLIVALKDVEHIEPGMLAEIATKTSALYLQGYEFDRAKSAAALADQYARLAERRGSVNLHTVLKALHDADYADKLFTLAPGERNIAKEAFWKGRERVKEAEAEYDAMIARAEAIDRDAGRPDLIDEVGADDEGDAAAPECAN
ncbi:MAG: hypothetical protein SGJ23_14360 [Alphaproteobacteria bacterium]|nr:hypothetical protein [Alphaproteobacteria bacterium]